MQYLSTQKVSKRCVRSAVTGSKNVTRSFDDIHSQPSGQENRYFISSVGERGPCVFNIPGALVLCGARTFHCGAKLWLPLPVRLQGKMFFPETVETDC